MKWVLIGDGESPHLVKWARALAPEVTLYAASSRGFAPELEALIAPERRLALHTHPAHGGGNAAVLRTLPRLARWLAQVDADWLHAHYLTSHGTLAWLARVGWRLRARLVGSAWGSDVLLAPERHAGYRWLTQRVLRACALATADSEHMATRMRSLGAREVMVFPFGLDAMPPPPPGKVPWRFYANRGLEPIYRPERVLRLFAAVAVQQPSAELVVANDGSLREALEREAAALGLGGRVRFTGRLDAPAQAAQYGEARWYLSLPSSDSISVSVLEAMAHGAVPIVSDLPANHEIVAPERGVIVADDASPAAVAALLAGMQPRAAQMGEAARAWVAEHALFAPSVAQFLGRVRAL